MLSVFNNKFLIEWGFINIPGGQTNNSHHNIVFPTSQNSTKYILLLDHPHYSRYAVTFFSTGGKTISGCFINLFMNEAPGQHGDIHQGYVTIGC